MRAGFETDTAINSNRRRNVQLGIASRDVQERGLLRSVNAESMASGRTNPRNQEYGISALDAGLMNPSSI